MLSLSKHENAPLAERTRPSAGSGRGECRARYLQPACIVLLLATTAAPTAAQDFSIVFGQGPGETRIIQFDDSDGNETWYMTRCQNEFSPDYYVLVREFGEAELIKPVNSALEAEKTVCVIGHIPDFVKRYMR